jgi:hypothetical protein
VALLLIICYYFFGLKITLQNKTEAVMTEVAQLNNKPKSKPKGKAHPWRRCVHGHHFVHEYRRHVEPSKENPSGLVTVHAYCARNFSEKEDLSYDEIQYITKEYFGDLAGPPAAGVLHFTNADKFDKEIRGWTKYWNDVLKPTEALDPNLVKALIATESSFRVDPQENKTARGLMQIMPNTRIYLQDIHGEIKDYYVMVTAEELLDPSANICAGIRWLFRKKVIVDKKLNRDASWIEAIAAYKDYLNAMIKDKDYNPRPMEDLKNFYKELQEV